MFDEDYDNIDRINDEYILKSNNKKCSISSLKDGNIINFDCNNRFFIDAYIENDIIQVSSNEDANDELKNYKYYNKKGKVIYEDNGEDQLISYIGNDKYIIDDTSKSKIIDKNGNIIKEYNDNYYIEAFNNLLFIENNNITQVYDLNLKLVNDKKCNSVFTFNNFYACKDSENSNYILFNYDNNSISDIKFVNLEILNLGDVDSGVFLFDENDNIYLAY